MRTKPIDIAGLAQLIERRAERRLIVGLAGAPGSGKSTIAEQLEKKLNVNHPHAAAILPMDGFHYDDKLLEELGRRSRKGAPDTFDVGGFRHLLKRLQENSESEIAVPVLIAPSKLRVAVPGSFPDMFARSLLKAITFC
jgi:pantothenate kinase